MAGVCVFAEITDQSVSETYLPLVAFGKSITDVSGGKSDRTGNW